MKKFFKRTMKEERGDVVQYIIVLAVVAIILAFAFPKIKSAMNDGTVNTVDKIGCAFDEDMTKDTCD